MKKFSLKKFEKDRNKSLDGSRKGDYKLINNLDGRDDLAESISNIRMRLHDVDCPHNNVGCDLPRVKRTLPQCKDCFIK